MKRIVTIGLLCAGCILAASAQTTFTQRLQEEKKGEGKVTVTQDKAIDELVNGSSTTVSKQTTPSTQTTQSTQSTQQQKTTEQQHKPDSGNTQKPAVAERTQQSDTTATDDGRNKVMKGGYKINGYRVQVYAGGNQRKDRQQATRVGNEIKSLFPSQPVYVHFYSPRWICRMGNFRTYEEAHQVLTSVRKMGYNAATIIKDKITVYH